MAKLRVKNVSDYLTQWAYEPFVDRYGEPVNPPENPLYSPGDVVYIAPTNSIGVVLGSIDHICEELRTDMDGMRCFSDIVLATEAHFSSEGVCVGSGLLKELFPSKPEPENCILYS